MNELVYEKVKRLAKERNISINQLEKKLEFSSSTISKWNNSNPTSSKLRKVALFFDVSMEYLLEEETLEEVK